MIKSFSKDNLFIISLDNKPVNSLKVDLLTSLDKVIDDINFNKYSALAITSNVKHFSAGADLKERSTFTYNQTVEFLNSLNKCFHKLENIPIPTIAVISGACLGGGLELALSCDFRIATEDSVLGFPETSIGIIPGAGGTQRMTRLCGISKSMKWIFTSGKFTAQEALVDGVVDFVPKIDIDEFLSNFINTLNSNSKNSIKLAKTSIKSAFIDHGYSTERQSYLSSLTHEDREEGLKSFIQKRRPKWTDS